VVKVRLEGLKIVRAKGKYYVYVRATGEALLKGFEGDKDALRKRLAMPDMIGAYNVRRKRDPKAYPEKTLGWLVAWFTDPDQCPEFGALSEVTQSEYKDRLNYLEPEFDYPLNLITSGSLYDVRDRCVKEKWPAFADKMMTALSSMFTEAVKRHIRTGMTSNPAIGVSRVSKPDPNANREWRPEEWTTVMALAPLKFKIVFMIARYIGYRSQSIVRVQWSNYQPDPKYGKCFRMTHKKNSEQHWVPAVQELQDFLDGLTRTSTFIATRHNGQPWRDEEQLQKQVSNFLTGLAKKGVVGKGLTEHGLRVTYAAAIKRKRGHRANNAAVAAALGDRDERMGAHYTRHVEKELGVIQAFGRARPRKAKK
jgi:integrase